jgi:hypothetical protein
MYRHIQRYMDRVFVYIYSIYIAVYVYRLCMNVYTKWHQKPTYIYIYILYIERVSWVMGSLKRVSTQWAGTVDSIHPQPVFT